MSVGTEDVLEILDTDLAKSELDPYITQAGELVTDDTVQTWLAAHLIRTSRDREADRESVNDHKITYSGESGLGLDSTRYGQMAQMFDTEGELPIAGGKESDIHITSW